MLRLVLVVKLVEAVVWLMQLLQVEELSLTSPLPGKEATLLAIWIR